MPLSFALATACTTPGKVNLVTFPEGADVYLKQGTNSQLLGKAPLNINLKDVVIPNLPFILLEVKKTEFQTQTITLPAGLQGFNHEIKLSLAPIEVAKQTIIQEERLAVAEDAAKVKCESLSQETLQTLGQGVATIQAFIQKKEYEAAYMKIVSLMTDYPNISVLYDLMGNIRYLQRDYGRALEAYRQSLTLSPQNSMTAEMVKRLENLTGKQGGNP